MKRYIIYLILSVCCSLPCLVQAQTMKVSPTLKKGKVVTYKSTKNIKSNGTTTIVTSSCKYTVTEETTDGYVVDAINTDFKVTGGDKMRNQMLALSFEFMSDVNIRFITDKNGRLKGIKNYDEARSKMKVNLDRIVNTLFTEQPEISKYSTKDEMKANIMGLISESQIIKDMTTDYDVMSLNGKTIISGAKEEYVDNNGMKMKRVYQVSGKKITSTSTLNMTKADFKKYLIDAVEKEAPENAEMVKNNIDLIIESGLKMDRSDKAIYDLADDGWVKTLTVASNMNMMGQETITNVTLNRQY